MISRSKSIAPGYITPEDFQEDENDFHISLGALPILYSTDWTSGTAVDQISRNVIDLDPRFQRRDAWSPADKSKFIESLALHIPIPQIILAEHPHQKRRYIVIDGKQRLLTLVQFLSDSSSGASYKRLRLVGLKEREDLNGKYFSDIRNTDDGAAIENAVIRTVIINGVRDEDFLYEVFLRLNTLGKSLSPQELRQALAPGQFTNFLDDRAVESDAIRHALNLRGPDRRMRDNELLLRFFAFKLHLDEYDGNFKRFLDNATKLGNQHWSSDKIIYFDAADNLDRAIELTFKLFGRRAFQSFERSKYTGRFNRAVFDIMAYFFSEPEIGLAASQNPSGVVAAFENLCQSDAEFRSFLSVNTKEAYNVYIRFSKWRSALAAALAMDIPAIGFNSKSGRIVID